MYNRGLDDDALLDHFNFRLFSMGHHHVRLLHWRWSQPSPFGIREFHALGDTFPVSPPPTVRSDDITLVESEGG